jgi:pimeloyl-ACP methyl ester carboxylesterase
MGKIVVSGAEVEYETFGEPGDPALLLIAGANSSMDGWDPDLCQRLAAGSRFVLRYDHRDTGGSTTWPAGRPGYTSQDLTGDAVALLDALGVERAHLVGVSMGGAIAQVLALDHPDRVASLILVATTSGPDEDLPPMRPELRKYFTEVQNPQWTDRAAVVEYLLGFQRALVPGPIDEPAARTMFTRMVDRSSDPEASLNTHNHVENGEPWRTRLGHLRVPTLVIHGEQDPLFPPGHGEALAREIPGARLLLVPGMGHEAPPRSTWGTVVPAILSHTSGG